MAGDRRFGRGALGGLLLVAVLAGAGCSSDEDSAADDVATPADASDKTTSNESPDGSDASSQPEPDGTGDGTAAGSVSIGSTEYAFEPSIQCSIFPGGRVAIGGSAVEDPSIEIILDVFAPGDHMLSVNGPGFEWTSTEPDFEVEIDDPNVRGTAEVRSSDGATEQSTFSFSCG